MTRSEIIELMARAMGDDTNRGNGGWSGTNDKDIYRSNAREILARLKSSGLAIVPVEPSEAMKDKGENIIVCGPLQKHLDASPSASWATAWACYEEMIATAIKEQEGRD